MADGTFTFRIDESLKADFSKAAKSRDRTGAQLLRDFMRDFVRQQQEAAAYDAWLSKQVRAGMDSADAGDLTPGEDVESHFSARREATRRRIETAE